MVAFDYGKINKKDKTKNIYKEINAVKKIILQEKYGTRDLIMCPNNKTHLLFD